LQKNDDGLFYMSWEEFVAAFGSAALFVEADSRKYCHSGHYLVDFEDEKSG